MIKIGILDDHEIVRTGLRLFLQDKGFETVFSAGNLADFLVALGEHEVDVLLVDVVLPDSKGISSFTTLLKEQPDIRILAYTSLNNRTLISMLVHAGVKGFLSKSAEMSDLPIALKTIHSGHVYLPEAYEKMLAATTEKKNPMTLSERELEVLELMADGKKTSAIAELLFISINTVESHRKNIFLKFEVNNIASLLNIAQKTGYIQ